ncbi:restriction endonuclease [Streptomyces chryseus]|uniref:restriction endonuclease n=1 Tax=Streptomyces chryseus TaxID=68186 RepID=UPI00110FDECC|nr:restriction endonuclease [Streptomyces chryseus]GGX40815.1 restriction endonuclease [Streptomyces chryseus]
MSRRPPARRRPRKRSRAARRQDPFVLGVAAVVAISLFVTVVNWLLAHWWILLIAFVLAAIGAGLWFHQKAQRAKWERVRAQGLRYQLSQIDALHHRQFEHAVRDLMKRDGCADAVQVGGAGDNGADVKATDPFGRRWVIQCKHRRAGLAGAAVGTPDLQKLNGTGRQIHYGDVIVMVTNGRFSSKAHPFARDQRLHLVDRRLLGEWAAGSRPLWELLNRIPPPRRSSSLQ